MRIVLATPLYPPEVADAAVYAKELSRRLAPSHDVTVVAYAHLPEQVPGVRVVAIDKRRPRLARLRTFRKALTAAVQNADALLAINGASVELPLLLVKRPRSMPLLFLTADRSAHERGGLLERLASARADRVVADLPPKRPEILPLEPTPDKELAAWEDAWKTHLTTLDSLLQNHD